MLSDIKLSLLQQLVYNASNEELIWTKGYLAGFLDKHAGLLPTGLSSEVTVKPIIIYGTETGNSKKVASGLLANFKKNKIQAKAIDVFQYDLAKLAKEDIVLFVMSTQGEGEFPQNAVAFYDALQASDAHFSQLRYAVFGLGDSSYPLFCNAGLLLDELLEKKGAVRLLPLVKSDVDYSESVAVWEKDLQSVLRNQISVTAAPTVLSTSVQKKNYTGIINHKVILNDRGSNKETFHIEITSDDVIHYEPGDAIGIIPKNDSHIIGIIAGYFKEDVENNVTIGDETNTIKRWLSRRNLSGLSRRSLSQMANYFEAEITEERADLVDILEKYPLADKAGIANLIALLLPVPPRLYSISSAFDAHDGQVHLTVNLHKFKVGNQVKTGLASQFLAEFPLNENIEFYIHKNPNFRLPSDDTDIIMIGPGTGIAPFRSFIAQRDSAGAEGKNWLFFGEQHFVTDFYYQTEIQDWLTSGVLTKLDVAFSQDQNEKIYVQNRILENAKDFNQWLDNGASLYICGQKAPMSTDVENAIIEVISLERNIDIGEAKAFLEKLEAEGRYQKDVY